MIARPNTSENPLINREFKYFQSISKFVFVELNINIETFLQCTDDKDDLIYEL